MPRFIKKQGQLIELNLTGTFRAKIGENAWASIRSLPREKRREALEKANAIVNAPTIPINTSRGPRNARNLDRQSKRLDIKRDLLPNVYVNKVGEIVEQQIISNGRFGQVMGSEFIADKDKKGVGYTDKDYNRQRANIYKKRNLPGAKPRSVKRKRVDKRHLFPDKPRISDFDPRNKYGTDPSVGDGKLMKQYIKKKKRKTNNFNQRKKGNEYAVVVSKVEEIVHLMVRAGGKTLNREKCFEFLMREYKYAHCDITAAWRILWSV